MIAKEELSKFRLKVMEEFINIELIINLIISQHYFGLAKRDFMLNVLYDDMFTFALRRNILEKILGDRFREIDTDLHMINKIRNIFAHRSQQVLVHRGAEMVVPNPKKPGEELDFRRLYEEFNERAPRVKKHLTKIYGEMGGVYSKETSIPKLKK